MRKTQGRPVMSRQRRREDGVYTLIPWAEALELAPTFLNVQAAVQMLVDLAARQAEHLTADEPAEQDSTDQKKRPLIASEDQQ